MNQPQPTSAEPQSTRELQSQAPRRVGQDGNPMQAPRLAQTRQKKQKAPQSPAKKSGKLKWALVASGAAAGGGLFFDFFA